MIDVRVKRTYRGITVDLAMRYLRNVGGQRVDQGEVSGDGWRASVTEEDPVGIGPTLTLTPVRVVFEGDEEVLDDVVDQFSQKAMRAGG